jgi:hypothetical protein
LALEEASNHLRGNLYLTSHFRFCGTFRTWRDVRLESVVRSKADVGGTGLIKVTLDNAASSVAVTLTS